MQRNRILQLLSDNRAAPRAFSVKASDDGTVATVYLYDVIVTDDWWGGVSAQSFVQALAGITADTIHLRINSPGGDVFAARAMETALRGHSARVIAHVDGVAASAASFVMLAADEVEITDGAFVMIHNAWTFAMGNADDLRESAKLLDAVDASLVRTYAKETGQSEDDISAWMAAETWMSSDEAVQRGFADRLAGAGADAQASAWNLSAYDRAPNAAHAQTPPRGPGAFAPPEQPSPDPKPPEPTPIPQASTDAPDMQAMRRRLELAQRS
ncbi:head maturation protease, ClpP-related [Burkholderia pseudomallei]|uniref:head maturation protease, ClpP-related n=1 Tax=Burkholderia pseudomallei TaxID=28450 RepID=UPI000A1A0F7A|nr:head maturation protease, ClpP-related [Burkholderia pseudomallei]ARL88579.1 peptidase S14 [Burkholderia pseudomallei]ARL98376.1 peptidase S14 [Burkholderia pseudomallei]